MLVHLTRTSMSLLELYHHAFAICIGRYMQEPWVATDSHSKDPLTRKLHGDRATALVIHDNVDLFATAVTAYRVDALVYGWSWCSFMWIDALWCASRCSLPYRCSDIEWCWTLAIGWYSIQYHWALYAWLVLYMHEWRWTLALGWSPLMHVLSSFM